jgi:PHD/YefM family antitoxin component YafN of YafNO toxin-antitoxin module
MRYQRNNYFLITQSLNIVQSNSYHKDMSELVAFGEHKARWVTISLDEYESMKSTIEVLSDPGLMEQIKESRADFKAGRFQTLQS